MSTFNLGQVAPVNKGEYNSITAYEALNMVSYKGGTWLSIAPSTGVEPGAGPGWEQKWMSAAIGIDEVSFSSPSAGNATMNVKFSDGTVKSFSFSTSAIAANAVGTNEIANEAVTREKLAPSLVAAMNNKYAPAYTFGTVDKVPGSPSTEAEGTIYWVVEEA